MNTRLTRSIFIVLLTLGLLPVMLSGLSLARAQDQPTSVPLVIPTLTPSPVVVLTDLPTRTATPALASQGRIEAKSADTGANLRAAPSTESEKLGTIFPGQFYAVIGRSNKWIQIAYDKVPSGVAWVYEDIVNISGLDPEAIPTINENAVPSPNVETAAAQATANILTQTPGAPQTATVLQASATGIFTVAPGTPDNDATRSEPLPTFTYPAAVAEATLRPSGIASTNQGGLPPIVPIIALVGLGLGGLFVSALRRM